MSHKKCLPSAIEILVDLMLGVKLDLLEMERCYDMLTTSNLHNAVPDPNKLSRILEKSMSTINADLVNIAEYNETNPTYPYPEARIILLKKLSRFFLKLNTRVKRR